MKTKWFIPSSRTFLSIIFTAAKQKSIAIITTKGFHSSQVLISAMQFYFTALWGRPRPPLMLYIWVEKVFTVAMQVCNRELPVDLYGKKLFQNKW